VLLFKKKPTFVGIHLAPHQLMISIIETNTPKQFTLKSLHKVPFTNGEYKNGNIHNLTVIKNNINRFITQQNAQSAYAVLTFAGPGFIERVINLTTGLPTYEHLATTSTVVWDYQPIGHTRSTGKTHYYLCGIQREKLLQLQLLAHLSAINCIQIIPQRIAVLNALAQLFPEAWQTATINNHATLQNFIDYYTDQCDTNIIATDQSVNDSPIGKELVVQALGIYLCGVTTYEQS